MTPKKTSRILDPPLDVAVAAACSGQALEDVLDAATVFIPSAIQVPVADFCYIQNYPRLSGAVSERVEEATSDPVFRVLVDIFSHCRRG